MARGPSGKRRRTRAVARPGPAGVTVNAVSRTPSGSWQSQIGSPSRAPTSPCALRSSRRIRPSSLGENTPPARRPR